MGQEEPTSSSQPSERKVLKERYELQESIEEGGMGHVFQAFDRVLHRKVAVKILSNIDSPDMVRRFEREAKTLSSLHHPNVASIYDYGVEGEHPFMVIEYIEGKTLSHYVASGQPIDIVKALGWIEQIADGLAAAHDQGIIHRDIKPENILVASQSSGERVVIIDFGLAISDFKNQDQARLTSSKIVMGTQRYMPPEQMEGQPPTPESDIYAFGLVCAELLAGPESISAGRFRSTFNIPEAAKPFWPVLVKACNEDPAQRWPRLRAMLSALKEARKSKSPWMPEVQSHPVQGRVKVKTVIGLMLLLVITFGIIIYSKDYFFPTEPVPVVSIVGTELHWLSKDSLEIRVHGKVLKSQAHRLILEAAVCDPSGTRITSPNGVLIDHALGVSQALDIIKAPQSFDRVVRLQIPRAVTKGYISVTVLDVNNLIISQQSSAFWPERPE